MQLLVVRCLLLANLEELLWIYIPKPESPGSRWMGDFCLQILWIYAVFIVPVCQFGVLLTARSHLMMATDIIGWNTIDRGRRGLNE